MMMPTCGQKEGAASRARDATILIPILYGVYGVYSSGFVRPNVKRDSYHISLS
jgi:hypothetical protein